MHHHLKTKIIWFGVNKCYQDHWKKIPILVYIILVLELNSMFQTWQLPPKPNIDHIDGRSLWISSSYYLHQ